MGSLVKIFPSQSQSAEIPHHLHSYPYMRVKGEEKEEIEERRIHPNL
jgi:hypothetical protein